MRKMLYPATGFLVGIVMITGGIIFARPSTLLDFVIFPTRIGSAAEEEIFFTIKWFNQQIRLTSTHRPKSDLVWSPHKKQLAFYERILEPEAGSYDKEWALQVLNPRTLQIKTVFVGDSRTSHYEWVDDQTVRMYMNAGTGVRIYRDVDTHVVQPFIAAEHRSAEFWKSQYNAKYAESEEEWRDLEPSGIEKLKDY